MFFPITLIRARLFLIRPDISFPRVRGGNHLAKILSIGGQAIVSGIIQQVIDDNTPEGWKIIYFPAKTYLVDTTLEWKSPQGRSQGSVFQGYHRDSTIIKLTDNNPDFQLEIVERPVLWTGESVAQKFDRGIRDLTVHTGSGNPGAVGIEFISNNERLISRVTIISGDGKGNIGLNMSGGENGPLLVSQVVIDGFNTGIKIGVLNSVTLSGITLHNIGDRGIVNASHVCSIENLTSTLQGKVVTNINKSAYLTLINSTLTGGSPDLPAIDNSGALFVRNVRTEGYGKAIKHMYSAEPDADSGYIEEATSHGVVSLFPGPRKSLNQSIKLPPEVPWKTDLGEWINIQDNGAIPDDDRDDSESRQAAVDAGGTTVYIPNNGRYLIKDTVYIRGKVNRFLGTNAWLQGYGSIILADGTPGVVKVERMRRQNPSQYIRVEKHSSRTLVIESAIFHYIIGKGSGEIYASDCLGEIHLLNPAVSMWCRHHNSEDPADTHWNIK